jgi:hypothetical protein
VVDAAGAIFRAEVIEPALAAPVGLGQLAAICDAFYDHLERRTLPGGCFFAGAVLEMGTRPGPVKERVAAFQADFLGLLRSCAAAAIDRRELPAEEDAASLAFELNGLILAANARFVLTDGADGLGLPRTVTRRRLGLPSDLPA